ncbi:MAG: DUF2892 domain-containing protein [Pseudomonadales bacterium]
MIERNLGNVERIVRLVFGVCLALWLWQQPSYTIADAMAGVVALFLILNGVFSRCYLWYVLDVSTAESVSSRGTCQ